MGRLVNFLFSKNQKIQNNENEISQRKIFDRMQRNPKIMRATITQNIGDVMQISFSEKNRKIEKLENNEIEISEKKASIA